MNTTAAGRQMAIFCQSGPTPVVSSASVASSRFEGRCGFESPDDRRVGAMLGFVDVNGVAWRDPA